MSPIKFLYLIIASTLRISDILSRNIEKTYANNCLHPSITQDGFYYINPDQNDPILVYCENGWTIVFNKIDYKGPSNVNYNKDFFAKPWTEYLGGFGSPDANFWIGLKRIRSLVQNEEMKMRIEANLLVNKKKPLYSIEYESFYVDSDSNQFRLKVGKKVSGNLIDDFKSMNGYRFYTEDNDLNGCAKQFRGGWWMYNCFHVCLTCQPPPTSASTNWFNNGDWMTFSKSKMMLKPVKVTLRPANCYEMYRSENFAKVDGVYYVYPDADSDTATKVYCEMNRGGWTRIFNRVNKSNQAFNKSWSEYKDGFGDIIGNHWLGLRNIQLLTFRKKMSLRIELWNDKSDHQFIEYDLFLVHSEEDGFKLQIGESKIGTLNDWLHGIHDGYRFHTRDHDDLYNSSQELGGGWWLGVSNQVCLTCANGVSEWSGVKTYMKMMIKPTFEF